MKSSTCWIPLAPLLGLLAACSLDAPPRNACRTDDDCLAGRRCVRLMCGGPAGEDGGSDGTAAPGAPPASSPDGAAAVSDGPPAGSADAAGLLADGAPVLAPDGGAAAGKDASSAAPQDAPPAPVDARPPPAPDAPPVAPVDAYVPSTADPCCAIKALCGAAAPAHADRGVAMVPSAFDFVPLCGGWIILGDRDANKIAVRNVFSGMETNSFQLAAAPSRVLLDPDRKLVFAALGPATTSLARVDLETGAVTSFTIPAAAKDIALSGTGVVLALVGGDDYSSDTLVALDEVTGSSWTIKASATNTPRDMHGEFGSRFAYRPQDGRLYMINAGLSPTSLGVVQLSIAARTLTPVWSVWDNGSNCKDVAVSDDGQHVAVPCGGGNAGVGYAIVDRSADDLDTVRGQWSTGAYPDGAAFSRDGKYFVSSNASDMAVFTVDTHVAVVTPMPLPGPSQCPSFQMDRVRASPDSAYGYGLTPTYVSDEKTCVAWQKLP